MRGKKANDDSIDTRDIDSPVSWLNNVSI
jgi:hypothetical protein